MRLGLVSSTIYEYENLEKEPRHREQLPLARASAILHLWRRLCMGYVALATGLISDKILLLLVPDFGISVLWLH